GPEVDGEHRLDADAAAPADELVNTDEVRLGAVPCQVEPDRPPLDRPDAVLPPVARDEVSARIPHGRDPELLDQLDYVTAEPVRIGGRVAGIVDAGVDATAKVLDERAEGPAVNGRDPVRRVDRDRRREHCGLLSGGDRG